MGCPSCGSSNVSFRRESVGEVRGRGAKQVVHRTVGICKDCGYTWERSSDEVAIKKPRKTWLWVIGWIFAFPIPLTILLLRKKNMNGILRAVIIAIAWIIYLLWIIGSASLENNATTQTTQTQVTETAPIDVSINVEPVVNTDNGKVLFKISTNLPEDTELLVTVSNDNGYRGQDKAVVLANGVANTAEFSDAGGGTDGDTGSGLKGHYEVTVSMSIARLQKESVRAVIGEKGENITGQYVKESDIGDAGNVVSATFAFDF